MVLDKKKCNKCLEKKDTTEFFKAATNKDGLQNHCKKCDQNRKTVWWRKKSLESGKKQHTKTLEAKELRKHGLKICSICREKKLLEEFGYNRRTSDGRTHICKICTVEYVKTHPETYKPKPEKYQRNKVRMRNNTLKREFGITLMEYNQMLQSQNGVCYVCGGVDINKSLAVDHCHKSGKVRRLLCGRCNPAIGFIKNLQVAEKIVEYFKEYKIGE